MEVDVYPDAKFRVYYSQPSPDSDGESTTFVFHLGAGYTGLSFGCLAKELRNVSNNKLGVLSFDARAHGKLFNFNKCISIMFILDNIR